MCFTGDLCFSPAFVRDKRIKTVYGFDYYYYYILFFFSKKERTEGTAAG